MSNIPGCKPSILKGAKPRISTCFTAPRDPSRSEYWVLEDTVDPPKALTTQRLKGFTGQPCLPGTVLWCVFGCWKFPEGPFSKRTVTNQTPLGIQIFKVMTQRLSILHLARWDPFGSKKESSHLWTTNFKICFKKIQSTVNRYSKSLLTGMTPHMSD